MTSHAGTSISYLNTFHKNNSLLFQFILAEFTESFAAIQKLSSLCGGMRTTANDTPLSSSFNSHRPEVEACLMKLVGSPNHQMRSFTWSPPDGLLAKLKMYCTLFLQNSEGDEKEFIALQHYADKIWLGCLEIAEVLKEKPFEATALTPAVEKVSAPMIRFSKLIARMVLEFRDDENVIFYIVRHHKFFDKLYGHRFVIKLLGKIYAKGLREAQHVLTKKYSLRGFENIVPAIHANIAEIEAAAS